MKISAILNKKGHKVHTICRDRRLKEVLTEMLELNIGSLLVMNEDDTIAGIITERDFLNNVAKHATDWENELVSDVMVTDVVVCSIDKRLVDAKTLIAKHHIRHLPIVDGDKVVGLLSIRDIIHSSLEESAFQNKLLKRYIHDWPEEDQN